MQDEKDRFSSLLEELQGLNKMMEDFMSTEGEGMIICEYCLDNVFDDDEDIREYTDDQGSIHQFCCEECLNSWKRERSGNN